MFELIVLGLILAGLAAITRAPAEKSRTENPTQPAPTLWSTRTDWHRFHKPTYRSPDLVSGSGRPVMAEPPVITTACGGKGPRWANPGCHFGRILKRYRIPAADCERVAFCHSIALLR